MSGNEERIRIQENHKKELMKRYESLYGDKAKALSDADKRTIQLKIDDLNQEIEELETEIKKLRTSKLEIGENFRGYSLEWEERLPEINFSKSKKIIRAIFDRFEDHQDGQAVFLLQRSRSMGGDLCIKHIRTLLQRMGTWYPPCEYGFPPHQQTNPIDFLNALASQFDAEPVKSITQHAIQEIVRKVCHPLRSGNVLLIHIEIYSLEIQDSFLEWFVNVFWNALVQQISIHRQDHPLIKLVAVIAVRGVVPKSHLHSALCCNKQKFDGRKILELPLEKWKETEICHWLWKFSGLDAPHIGRTRSEIEQIAKTIYTVSEGKPSDVRHELMEALRKEMTRSAS
jgi:hypothetical protein